ncbi:MAG: glycosyltransferase family 4 protein [Candidatus Micrarchaeota archaeon]
MKAVLLTGNSFSKVPAGVEQFSESLKKIFPNLRIISFEETGQAALPILKEPSKAKAVADYLAKHLDQYDPDVVFFNASYGWALPAKTSYLKVGICHGTNVSFAKNAMVWGLDRLRIQLAYAWFEKKSLQNADLIVSNSEFTRKLLKKDYGLDSVHVPFAVDFSVFKPADQKKSRQQTGLPLDKKIVLFVGRPDYSKGFDVAEKLAKQNPDWHFVSVTFPKAQSDCIDCRGPFDSKTVAQYYAACDAVLFPSRFEGFGFVTLEALACNRPVVTTDFGVARELGHPACIKVPDFSVDSFQSGLSKALFGKFEFNESLEKEFGLSGFSKRFNAVVQKSLDDKNKRS